MLVHAGVLISVEVCEEIAPLLSRAMSEQTYRDGVTFSAGALAAEQELKRAAQASRARREVAQEVAPSSPVGLHQTKVTPMELTPEQYAVATGVRRQAVSKRLKKGTLAGRQDERGRWFIPAPDTGGEA